MASTVNGRFDNYLRQLCPDNMPSLVREQGSVAVEGIGRAGDTDGRRGVVANLLVFDLIDHRTETYSGCGTCSVARKMELLADDPTVHYDQDNT